MELVEKKQGATSTMMLKQGLTVGIPIILGYLPIAITYGVLAKQAGLSLLELTMMSVLVYAGASQFMGVNMIAVGVGAMEIIIATFILNSRHFVMSLSFMHAIRDMKTAWRFPLTLTLTDESFAVSSMHTDAVSKKHGKWFYISLFFTAYLSWIFGSFLGGVLGEIIPDKLSQSMGIALYAMFIGLLVPTVKKELKLACIAIIAMLIHTLCSEVFHLSTGWAIVIATILGGFSGVFLMKEQES